MAERSGLSYKFIGEIERGMVNPSLETLISIANALHVEFVELFSSATFMVLAKTDITKIQNALTDLIDVFEAK